MAILAFPPVDDADEDGLLAIGGDLEVESLLLAYQSGIFPWPMDKKHLTWFAPPLRAIVRFNQVSINRSLKRALKQFPFELRINTAFAEVIHHCKKVPRKKQKGTWITPAIEEAYRVLHERGFAHSVECFLDNPLVGGIYGVGIGQFFAGESMFHLVPNASKVAFHGLVYHLSSQGGSWMDCQVLNPFIASLGAVEISRNVFMAELQAALSSKPIFSFPKGALHGFPQNIS